MGLVTDIKPEISVIMPVYNAEKTVRRAIESVLDQTYSNYEFLIVYDECTDSTYDIISEYSKIDSRIRIIKNNKNKGVATALNIGVLASQGIYIARMDADDFSYPCRFEKQIKYMDEYRDIYILGTAIRQIVNGGRDFIYYPKKAEEIKARIPFYGAVMHPAVMIRKSFFENGRNLYNEESPAEDYELWLRNMPELADHMSNLDDVLLDHYMDAYHASLDESSIRDTIVVRKQFAKRIFEIYPDRYSDMTFFHGLLHKDFIKGRREIINLYHFLIETDIKNDKSGYCSGKYLRKELALLWNRGVKNYLEIQGVKDTEALKIRVKRVDYTDSFVEILQKTTGLSIDEMDLLLDAMVNRRIKAADELGRIVIYGLGEVCQKYLDAVNGSINVVGVIDSDRLRWGTEFMGKTISGPGILLKGDYDTVLIGTTRFYKEIKRMLIDGYGISKNKISSIELAKFVTT